MIMHDPKVMSVATVLMYLCGFITQCLGTLKDDISMCMQKGLLTVGEGCSPSWP